MAFGLDFVSGPSIAAMKAAGVAFVCRYVGYFSGYNTREVAVPQGKVLTPAEATADAAAGIALVSNYEWYASRATEGNAAGVWDAHTADSIHRACGGPPHRPIYFSVDEDVEGVQVADYFKGVASVIGLARTGVYGSYRVLQYLFDQGLITWGWQTYAWSNGAWEPRAHIQQYQNGMSLAGASVDYNRSMTRDYGQWFPQGGTSMGLPSNWHLSADGQTLYCKNHFQGQPDVPVQFGFKACVQPLLESGAWPNEDVFLGPQYYIRQLEYSNPDLGDGDQIVSLFGRMLCYPHNPQGAVAHLKNTVVFEYTGVELYAARAQWTRYSGIAQQLNDELVAEKAKNEALTAQVAQLEQQIATLSQPTADAQAIVQIKQIVSAL